jgi:hypothetical protein
MHITGTPERSPRLCHMRRGVTTPSINQEETMPEPTSRRQFWCLLTMPVSGVIAVVSPIMRRFSGIPGAEPSRWAEIACASTYVPSQYEYAVAYVLPFLGFRALYAHIRDQDRAEGRAIRGLMGALIGTALALPTLGLRAVAGPELRWPRMELLSYLDSARQSCWYQAGCFSSHPERRSWQDSVPADHAC